MPTPRQKGMRVISPSIQRRGAKVTNKNNGSEDDDQTNLKKGRKEKGVK